MPTNFDEIIDRRGTASIKYDFAAERGYPSGVLPFWVADMDFRAPAPILDALTCRTAHGIFGYTQVKDDYFAVLQHWFKTRHNWNAELERIAEICLRRRVLVVADEIHEEFIRPGFTHTPFAALSPEAAAITVTCTSPSKTFNLAGLQISNIFIKNDELRSRFRTERGKTGYDEPNTLGLCAAHAAYEHGAPWLTELLAYIETNYEYTKAYLAQYLPQIKIVEPEGTYLLWLDFRAYGLSDKALNDKIVHEANLWLDDGPIFGTGGSGFQRINIACPRATLERGLEQLVQAFR